MRRFFYLMVIMFVSLPVFAQLGKVQYEDAEEQFAAGKYEDAIELLDQAEKSNGGANPPIMHLRILSRIEIIKKDPDKDFSIIDAARKESNLFLEKYSGDARLEDKYREVYQASKTLKGLPATRQEFDAKIAAALKKENDIKEKFEKFKFTDLYTSGESPEVTREKFKVKRREIGDYGNGYKKANLNSYYITLYDGRKEEMQVLFRYFNDKAVSYECLWGFNDDANHNIGITELEKERLYYTDLFGFEPKKEVSKYDARNITYIWQLGDKFFSFKLLVLSSDTNRGIDHSMIIYEGFDSVKAYSDIIKNGY